MEKEHQPDSMATITMKPEYPPSEYSASEPPPAYRHHGSTSVQIARIVALTVVASSFILGSFILASSWVSARSSCHQLEQLDAMLDKELALEGRAYGNDGLMADEPLPVHNAHALHAAAPLPSLEAPASSAEPGSNRVPVAESQRKDDALNHAESKINEDKLQKLDGSSTKNEQNSDSDESSESDSSAEEEDELDGVRPMFKLPIQFDLDELAGAFLANSQKGRMNCVVERRHEEPMERRFPFNILGAFAPRAASASAERVAIICHGGDEQRPMNFPEPQSQVFAFPLSGPVRLPLRPQSDRPLSTMASEPRMPPFAPLSQHRPAPFPMPMPWDSSEEQMGAPREMRIHVQRVMAIPAQHNVPPPAPQGDDLGPFQPPPLPPQQQQDQERQAVMHQFVPQPAPIQELEQPEMQKISGQGQMNLPWGLTPEDLHNIHRSAEEAAAMHHRNQQLDNDMQEVPEAFLMAPGKIPNEVKTIVDTLAAAEAQAEQEAEEQRQHQQQQQQQQQQQAQQLEDAQSPRAPRTMMLPQDMPNDERPHYVQPRSVRSVDAMLHREKRVKRCACNCA